MRAARALAWREVVRFLRQPSRIVGAFAPPLLAWLREKTWSPYAAGGVLGLVVAFSGVVFGRPLAASGAFVFWAA